MNRRASSRRLLAPVVGAAAATAIVVALAGLAPEPALHLPWWLVIVMFTLAGVDGYLGGDDRMGLSPPASRVVVIIGLVFDLPLHLLGAQVLAMSVVALLPDGRTGQEKLLDATGSLIATCLGVLAFLALSDPVPASGRTVWLDAGVAGVVVVVTSHVIEAVRRRSATEGSTVSARDRTKAIGRDLTAVTGGLLIVELLRVDVAAGWLLALPMFGLLLARRQMADISARAASLLRLGEAEAEVRASLDTEAAAQVTAQQVAAMTRAVRVHVAITLPPAPTVTVVVTPGTTPRRRWALLRAQREECDPRWEPGDEVVDTGSRECTVVAVTDGAKRLGAIEVLDRPASSRIWRIHGEAIRLLANALGQHLQLIQRLEELRRISERNRRLADRLHSANQELEQIDAARSVFLATTSHELRGPLSALLAEAQVLDHLARADAMDPDVRQLIGGVGENARHLLRMVDDLLALVRLEADLLDVVWLPLDLVEVVETVADTFRPMLAASGIELTLATPARALIVGDRDRVWQVLANLVDNAVRVMPDGGAITIEVERAAGTTRLAVADTGPGIAADDLDRLFAPFERGAVRGPGLGLGLAIARSLMERHGGHLDADGGVGRGTTFTAVFPDAAHVAQGVSGPADRTPPAPAHTVPGRVSSPGTEQPRPA